MSNVKKIPKSIKEIIYVFIRKNFQSLTISDIADELKIDQNAITQRIIRYENDYFQIIKKRPKTMVLKPKIKEIIFFKDNNQCQFCKKTFPQDKLNIRQINPNSRNPLNYLNYISICNNCNKGKIKLPSKKGKAKKKTKSEIPEVWKYKKVNIIKRIDYEKNSKGEPNYFIVDYVQKSLDPNSLYDFLIYYEFDDLEGDGWNYLYEGNNEDEIASLELVDILNYFGENGWELVTIREKDFPSERSYPRFNWYSKYNQSYFGITSIQPDKLKPEGYECIFKKRVKE